MPAAKGALSTCSPPPQPFTPTLPPTTTHTTTSHSAASARGRFAARAGRAAAVCGGGSGGPLEKRPPGAGAGERPATTGAHHSKNAIKTGVKPFSAPTKTLNTPGGRKKIILQALGRWQPQLEDFAALGAHMPFDGAAFPRAGGARSGTAPRRTQGGTCAPRGRGRRLTVRGRGERGAWGCARARRGGVGERDARGLISGVRGGLAPCPRRLSEG